MPRESPYQQMARSMGDVELYEAIEDEVELRRNDLPHNATLLAVLRRELSRRSDKLNTSEAAQAGKASQMLRVTANATKDLEPQERWCTCCNARLSGRFAWLELDQRIDAYHDLGGVPPEKSQGWFPFGLTCARKAKEHGLARSYLINQ